MNFYQTFNKSRERSTNKQLIEIRTKIYPEICASVKFLFRKQDIERLSLKPNSFNNLLSIHPADSIYIIAEQAEVHYIVC